VVVEPIDDLVDFFYLSCHGNLQPFKVQDVAFSLSLEKRSLKFPDLPGLANLIVCPCYGLKLDALRLGMVAGFFNRAYRRVPEFGMVFYLPAAHLVNGIVKRSWMIC
jgi:hypothetical protein